MAREAADWRSGPRWSILSVLCPVHPFATTWHFPSRGNKKFEEKNRESYTSCTTPAFPLWWLAPSPFRPAGKRVTGFSVAYGSLRIQFPCHRKRGHYQAPLCCELLMKGLLCGSLLSHRSAGGRWCRKVPKGGSHRRWLIDVMFFMPYDIESQSRNADFISIARKGNTTTLGPAGPVKPKNPPAHRAGQS